jgi:dephospho-CoA kinase
LLARGLSPEQAQSRIDAQFTSERKAVLADFVLLSCGSEEFLEQQVHFFLKSFKSKQPES